MSIQIKDSDNKIHQVINIIKKCSILIGKKDERESELPYQTGLGMITAAESLVEFADNLEKNLFNILFLGNFNTGKSTLINAVAGQQLLVTGVTVTTPFLSLVKYGENKDMIKIHHKFSSEIDEVTPEQYLEKYVLRDQEENAMNNDYSDISYAIIENPAEILNGGLCFVDSPGLEKSETDNCVTNEYIPKANAIIFVLSATDLFSQIEKNYIAFNFAGKNRENVFFVINKIDSLTPGALEGSIIPFVRKELEYVFTDEQGFFNEELYRKRVFFTNAYGAMCARVGIPYKLYVGKKEILVPIDLEDTGILELENAISSFFNSNERLYAQVHSALQYIVAVYKNVKRRIETDKEIRKIPLREVKSKIDSSEKILSELRQQIAFMKAFLDKKGNVVSKKIYCSLFKYIENEFMQEFSNEITEKDVRAGLKVLAQLTVSEAINALPLNLHSDTPMAVKQYIQKLTNKINDFMKYKFAVWQENIGVEIEKDLQEIECFMNEQINKFDDGLNKAESMFHYHESDNCTISHMELVFEINSRDVLDYNMLSYSTIYHAKLQQELIFFACSCDIILPYSPYQYLMDLFTLASSKRILDKLKTDIFENTLKYVRMQKSEIENNYRKNFNMISEALLNKAEDLLDDMENYQKRILNDAQMNADEYTKESQHQDYILHEFGKCISNVYSLLYGREIGISDIEKM